MKKKIRLGRGRIEKKRDWIGRRSDLVRKIR
jgi:hypothetical protein